MEKEGLVYLLDAILFHLIALLSCSPRCGKTNTLQKQSFLNARHSLSPSCENGVEKKK